MRGGAAIGMRGGAAIGMRGGAAIGMRGGAAIGRGAAPMILRDPIHGLVAFESEEDAIVTRLLATSEVQRLRRIRQLGLTSFAFPGAEHTRFAHAIGAARVMQLFLARLRQVDGDLPFWQQVTSERARDALAAAFLHDVGHGPLSHLFEEAVPGAPSHESWTERILLDPSSEVHHVLVADDAYLPQRVAEHVHRRHALPYHSTAVSGTFDVDRCDYLLRDALATGVRFGEYYLPWLIRRLRFVEAAQPGLAIEGTKGLAAIEAFLLARYFMFQQVYFHKSTRAAEWMIGAILRRALALVRDGTRLPSMPPALASIAAGDAPTLDQYLELDDQVLLTALHEWEGSSDKLLADLCRRIRARALFKTIELFPEKDGKEARTAEEALEIARDIATAAGLDPSIHVGLDVASDTPYADDASLKVMFPKGRVRLPSEVSFLLDRLRNETIDRVRILFAPELREAMREALYR